MRKAIASLLVLAPLLAACSVEQPVLPELKGKWFAPDMIRAMEQNAIRPVIDRTFPLTELREALAYLKSQRHVGKVCVEM